MEHYMGAVKHNENTVKKLNQVVHDINRGKQKLFYAVSGTMLLLAGALGKIDQRISLVLLALGCWCLQAVNYGARARTAEMKKALNGYYPSIHYSFKDDKVDMRIKQWEECVEYTGIVRLAYDRKYVYFFPEPTSIYMIERESIMPGTFPDFCRFLSEKTGCDWIELDASNVQKVCRAVKKLIKK